MAANGPSGFFSLPTELRNYIYTLAFADSTTGVGVPSKVPVNYRTFCRHPETTQHLPGILFASKHARNETLSIFFETTTFVFSVGDIFLHWLRRLEPRLRGFVRRACVQVKAPTADYFSEAVRGTKEDAGKFYLLGFERRCRQLGVSELQFGVMLWLDDLKEIYWSKGD